MPKTLAAAMTATAVLPTDASAASLVGRVWHPGEEGPAVVVVREGRVFDITRQFATVRDLCEHAEPAKFVHALQGTPLGPLDAILANTPVDGRDRTKPWLLAPLDLQVIKAAGVTFAISMLERVIEERAKGDPQTAASIRAEVTRLVGNDLRALKPGSPAAAALKQSLIERGMWSQYLEVGIGPDAEVFTKAPVLSAVGTGSDAGLNPVSTWNNPEPEVVLFVSSTGRIVGATLGNDVNLRDVEGRSALLLAKAKDNNASAAIGPFLRLFDDGFSLDDVRAMQVSLTIAGEDGYALKGASRMAEISRDPADIAAQTVNAHHQYPDGFVLYLGTLFAPVEDRDTPGQGFTHKAGDIVTVASAQLGALTNRMRPTNACEPWTFSASHLMRNLARRGLLV